MWPTTAEKESIIGTLGVVTVLLGSVLCEIYLYFNNHSSDYNIQ